MRADVVDQARSAVLAEPDTIVSLCNASMTEGIFPDVLKHAIVRPMLKKPTLDPAELSTYRPL